MNAWMRDSHAALLKHFLTWDILYSCRWEAWHTLFTWASKLNLESKIIPRSRTCLAGMIFSPLKLMQSWATGQGLTFRDTSNVSVLSALSFSKFDVTQEWIIARYLFSCQKHKYYHQSKKEYTIVCHQHNNENSPPVPSEFHRVGVNVLWKELGPILTLVVHHTWVSLNFTDGFRKTIWNLVKSWR